MNHAEFLEEVKSSPLCPENFEAIYADFQGFQKAALNTLKEVHRVCENNAIAYQVAYGSLLGLIRDGGQIPGTTISISSSPMSRRPPSLPP